jgi:hypothetical protein
LPADRPLLFLDVDGTLLPELTGPAPDAFEPVRARGLDLWVPLHLRSALPRLAKRYEVVWCTDWEDGANVTVAPLFGVAGDLPVIRHQPGRSRWWKLEGVAAYAGERALAWADDRMRNEARRWAQARAGETLLLQPDPARGLTEEDVVALGAFALSRGQPES